MATLEEVVVTAQKQIERLQDVPVPVTALSADILAEMSQLRLQDYYRKVPGLALVLAGDAGAPVVVIRGISTGATANPTVGVVIDDVSYGSSTNQTGFTAPDVDPNDLARVEVLRGPQGTLYGASSMGGLVKFVTIDPSTDAFKGRVQAGVTSVTDGEMGYNFHGALNMPLGDSLAVRASGFMSRDPGYIDNVRTGEDDINRRDSEGSRLAALWRPSDAFSMKLSALIQNSERFGTEDADKTLGTNDLRRNTLRSTGGYVRDTQAYAATTVAALGPVELTSATGYNVDKQESELDASPFLAPRAQQFFGVGGVSVPIHRRAEKFTQELRAAIPLGERVDWLLGGFYTDEDINVELVDFAVDAASGSRVGTLLTIDQPSTFEEYAAFTNLTFKVTDRFDIQIGGRLSENKQTFSAERTGPLVAVNFGGVFTVPQAESKESGVFTYLFTPRFKLADDLMLYARVASGYRPGGPNAICGTPNVPCEYDADTTDNYEIGMKGTVLNDALSFDASAYYIDWQDLQITIFAPGFLAYIGNTSRATSQGVELSLESRPLDGLSVSAWFAYNDAELTEDFPSTSSTAGHRGDRLPFSSKLSGNLSVDQEFPLGARFTGLVGASVSYVDDRKGSFRSATQVRETFPSYTQIDVRTGVTYESWTLNAFVNNVSDERGILRSGLDSIRPDFVTYIQPRTFGLSFTKSFE